MKPNLNWWLMPHRRPPYMVDWLRAVNRCRWSLQNCQYEPLVVLWMRSTHCAFPKDGTSGEVKHSFCTPFVVGRMSNFESWYEIRLSTRSFVEYGEVQVSVYVGPPVSMFDAADGGRSELMPTFVTLRGSFPYWKASLFFGDTCQVIWSALID